MNLFPTPPNLTPRQQQERRVIYWIFALILLGTLVVAMVQVHNGAGHIYTPTEVCQSDWNSFGVNTGESHGYFMAICEQNLKTEVKVREQQNQ